jgi:hypothetical protein
LICLKRYTAENIDGRLNIIKFTCEVKFDTLIVPDGITYNLKSFVSHYGNNSNSNHYKAAVSFGRKFLDFSDENITVFDTAVSSNECYLLAYQAPHQDNLDWKLWYWIVCISIK